MYYSQTALESIPEEHRSLLAAFANTAKYFGHDVSPETLYTTITSDDPVIDYDVLPEYVPQLVLKERGEEVWPVENGAITHVRRYEEEKMYFVDHYLLVIDASQHAVVDSYDGIIKNGDSYGSIVDWIVYETAPEPVDKTAYTAHVVSAHENLWDVGRKLNMKVDELMEFNAITDPRVVKEGYVIYVPPREVVDRQTIRYELLNTPEDMHVSRSEGARKLMFGDATTFSDIKETGRTHALNSNHSIVAIAYVDLDDSDAPAAYYLDRLDAGNIASTGLPRYTTGFNHSHMATGHITSTTPVDIRPDIVEKIEEAKEKLVEVPVADVVEDVLPVEAIEEHPPRTWKDDLSYLRDDEQPETYTAKMNFYVYDQDGNLPPRPMKYKQKIALTYGLMFNGELYGLPQSFVDDDIKYLFPISKLAPEDDDSLYNLSIYDRISLRKAHMGSRLSASEQSVVVLSKLLAYGPKLKQVIKRKIKK